MAQQAKYILYVDRAGVEHDALVKALNGLNEGVVDLVYIDSKNDAVVTEFGVPHMSDDSRKETNPDLPQYTLNCWKEPGEEHLALPKDHPNNDHPFKLKEQDASGRIVEKPRPEFAQHIAAVAAESAIQEPAKVDIPEVAIKETPQAEPGTPSDAGPSEPDVTAQLDAAGPAPVTEEEKKPEDAA